MSDFVRLMNAMCKLSFGMDFDSTIKESFKAMEMDDDELGEAIKKAIAENNEQLKIILISELCNRIKLNI